MRHLELQQPGRAALAGSQIVGFGVLRRIIGFAPLRDLSPDEVVAWLGPQLQRTLTWSDTGD